MSDEEAANSEPQEYADILNTVDSTAFGKDDWNIVVTECGSLAAKWEELSTCLGLPYGSIASIKGNHPNDNYGCWSDALNQWISQNYNTDRFGVPSWMTLLKAVAKVDQLLYKKLAKKHQNESIEEIDVEGNSSDSETSDSSPRQLCDPESEEPQYIIISSGEESIVEEENLIKQGTSSGCVSRPDCHSQDGTPCVDIGSSSSNGRSVPSSIPSGSGGKLQLERGSESSKFNEVDDTLLGEENAVDVKKATVSLASRFHSFGMVLGLETSELDTIREDFPHNSDQSLSRVIDTWLKQRYDVSRHGHPSWKKLVEAVASEAGGKNPALAMKIADALPGRKRNHDGIDVPPTKVPRIEAAAPLMKFRPLPTVKKRNHDGVDVPPTKVPRIEVCVADAPLMKFRPKLADFYSKKPELPESTWPPVKKTHYVNLALIKPQPMNYSKDYVRQTVRGSIDDIFKDKEEIKYEDAFNKHDDNIRIMIILEGRPGCGKTTLMHKLSQDWEKGLVLQSYLLFLVHLRRFNNRSDIQLSDILQATTRNFTKDDIEQMCKLIEETSGRGVVFALDGLDEYLPKSDNFVYSLIKGEQLSNAVVVVASRPAATHQFRNYASKHVEVLGFLEPQIHEYVNNYFTECPDKARGLLHYLKQHLNIMHMCYLPLHVAMVTHLYEVEGDRLPQTETEIYRHFTLSTLIRSSRKRCPDPSEPFYLQDFDQLSTEDQTVFSMVLKLAFSATVESRQVFTLQDLRKHIPGKSSSRGDDESTLGLIVVDRYYVKYALDEIYSFLHLTFQEYIASVYIANQTEEEQKRIITSHGSKRNLYEVWKFYCGIGKCSRDNFELLLSETQTSIKKYQMQSMLLHLHCCYESQQEWTCSQVVKTYDSCIELSKQSLNPSDMTALGYVMSHSETPLKKLVISSCYVGPEGLTALATEIREKTPALEVLSFQGTKIKSEMTDSFADLLKLFSSTQELNLSSSVSKSTLSDISKKIPELPSVKTLDISSNRLGNTGSAAKAFLDKLPKLQTLKVHLYKDYHWYMSMKKDNQLKDINVKTIVPRVESEQDLATCTKLDLIRLNISIKEAEIIGERLKECTNLSKLNLGNNQIGATGAHAIAEGCKLCPNLQTIDLDINQIGDTGAQAIAEGYKLCPDLNYLSLRQNQIGDTGAQTIAEGCKLCPNLQTIDLQVNSITDASVPQLIGLIETARKLETLNLWNNQFTDAGRSQLRQAAEKRNNDQANYVHLDLSV